MERILRGYSRALRGLFLFLALLLLCGFISFAFVWPLWSLATRYRGVYTLIVLVVFGGALSTLVVFKIRASVIESGTIFRQRLSRSLKRFLLLPLFLGALYGILWLVSLELYVLAALSLLLCVLVFGLIRYGGKRTLASR